jgi:hypothetical protein
MSPLSDSTKLSSASLYCASHNVPKGKSQHYVEDIQDDNAGLVGSLARGLPVFVKIHELLLRNRIVVELRRIPYLAVWARPQEN